jgi:hypothetical protein
MSVRDSTREMMIRDAGQATDRRRLPRCSRRVALIAGGL